MFKLVIQPGHLNNKNNNNNKLNSTQLNSNSSYNRITWITKKTITTTTTSNFETGQNKYYHLKLSGQLLNGVPAPCLFQFKLFLWQIVDVLVITLFPEVNVIGVVFSSWVCAKVNALLLKLIIVGLESFVNVLALLFLVAELILFQGAPFLRGWKCDASTYLSFRGTYLSLRGTYHLSFVGTYLSFVGTYLLFVGTLLSLSGKYFPFRGIFSLWVRIPLLTLRCLKNSKMHICCPNKWA